MFSQVNQVTFTNDTLLPSNEPMFDGAWKPDCQSNCTDKQISISLMVTCSACVIFILNLMLISAVASWSGGRTCKMFWFLAHLASADAIIAFGFIFYHGRSLSTCPQRRECTPGYFYESIFVMVILLGGYLSSHLFMLAITVDRFIAVLFPLKYAKFTRTRIVRTSAGLMWGISFGFPFICSIPLSLGDVKERKMVYGLLTITCCVFSLLIALTVVILNTLIISKAASIMFSAKPAVHKNNALPVAQSDVINQRVAHLRPNVVSTKLLATLGLFVISFLVTCVPWSVTLISCSPQPCEIKRDGDYSLIMLLLHALLIPVIYGIRVGEVKDRFVFFWNQMTSKILHLSVRNSAS